MDNTQADAHGEGFESLLWADLSADAIDRLYALEDPHKQIDELADILSIAHYRDNARSGIMVDFCFYNVMFCRENAFTHAKTSAFFSIMKQVFLNAFQPQDGVMGTMADSLDYFQSQLMKHCVGDSDAYESVFTTEDIRLITEFIGKSFYRHFNAYTYCFTHMQEVDNQVQHVQVDTPMRPMALSNAL